MEPLLSDHQLASLLIRILRWEGRDWVRVLAHGLELEVNNFPLTPEEAAGIDAILNFDPMSQSENQP